MEKSNTSIQSSDINYSTTNFGMRFRIKRTHDEMIKTSIPSEPNPLEITQSSCKKPKLIKEKEVIQSPPNKENVLPSSPHSPFSIVYSKEKEEIQKQRIPTDILAKEYNRIKSTFEKLVDKFNNEKMNHLIKKISKYCKKYITREIKVHKIIKIVDHFKDRKITLEKEYPKETCVINFELSLIDILIKENNEYDQILLGDSHIGNLLLYYYSQIFLISILENALPCIEMNIQKIDEGKKLTFKNIDNQKNTLKNKMLGEVYNSLKTYKGKYQKETKSKFHFDYINNFYNSNIYDIFNNKKYEHLNDLFVFDFDKEEEIKNMLSNNELYSCSQFQIGGFQNKIMNHLCKLKAQYIEKRVKIYKIQKMNNNFYSKINSKILNFSIYYTNTAELISDFLNDNES